MLSILPDRPSLSAAEAALLESERVSNNALELLRGATVASFRSFWQGTVPVELQLATLGTNAVAMFQKHQATVQYLLSMGVQMDPADYTPPRPYHATEDGRVLLD